MLKALATLYPRKSKEHIKSLLRYTDLKTEPNKFLGFSFFVSISVAVIASVLFSNLLGFTLPNSLIVLAAAFALLQFIFYFSLIFMADGKAKAIERVLPDALQLISSNLKAGFTVERAILLSSRPEFGIFANELNSIGREVSTGKSIEAAMKEMTSRVKSQKLQKTIELIIHGIQSGGKLSLLLTQTSQNLRNQELMEERVRVSVLTYYIFIMSAVTLAAPAIFALSSFLAEVMLSQLSTVSIPEGVAIPLTLSSTSLTSSFIIYFIVAILVTLSTFGSIALGMIKTGKGKEGVKYIPILLSLSLGVFFLVRFVISRVFSGLVQ